jgi:cytochrome c oxidase subunit II
MTIRSGIKIALLVGAIFCAKSAGVRASGSGRQIDIVAKRFAFEPSEITVKKGESVTLSITSEDVDHGLAIDELGIRAEVKKGEPASVPLTPETEGTFSGKCAHFCGRGHGTMTLTVHVVE